jgi:hypothetical protein
MIFEFFLFIVSLVLMPFVVHESGLLSAIGVQLFGCSRSVVWL